jgi:putative SOS response-associated peptidase YedK
MFGLNQLIVHRFPLHIIQRPIDRVADTTNGERAAPMQTGRAAHSILQHHHERSPVLLNNETEMETWLSGGTALAGKLIGPTPADRMHIVHEGFEKNDLLKAA